MNDQLAKIMFGYQLLLFYTVELDFSAAEYIDLQHSSAQTGWKLDWEHAI